MRTVALKTWREYVRDDEIEQLHPAYRGYLYYARRRYFNQWSFGGSLIALCFFTGLASHLCLVLGISLCVFAAYLYFSAKAAAEGVQIRRRAPGKAIELETLEVEYEVENRSGFRLYNAVLVDHFTGAVNSREVIWLDQTIEANATVKGNYKKKCDGGMGVFAFGPLSVLVSDALGVFEFLVTVEAERRTEVYPKLEQIPAFPLHGSQESFLYGVYDLPTRGSSVNFNGIRDYTRGDSLRHIAWKLSVRANKLLVKEFEKVANTEISVLLNMSARDHMGRKSESTWEYAKDAALSLITQQIANGNSTQLLSEVAHVPFGRGEAHANVIARRIFGLLPAPPIDRFDDRNVVERSFPLVPAGSTAIYIGPIFGSDPQRLVRALVKLRLNRVEVFCVLIQPSGFVNGKVHGDSRTMVESGGWKAQALVENISVQLSDLGVHTYVLENGRSIGSCLLERKRAR